MFTKTTHGSVDMARTPASPGGTLASAHAGLGLSGWAVVLNLSRLQAGLDGVHVVDSCRRRQCIAFANPGARGPLLAELRGTHSASFRDQICTDGEVSGKMCGDVRAERRSCCSEALGTSSSHVARGGTSMYVALSFRARGPTFPAQWGSGMVPPTSTAAVLTCSSPKPLYQPSSH